MVSILGRRILAVSLDGGSLIWESMGILGEGAGSPQVTNDGRHVGVTHNANQEGYFSLFDMEKNDTAPIYQYQSDLMVFDETTPFSAVG